MTDKYILAEDAALIDDRIKKIESFTNAVIASDDVPAVHEGLHTSLFDSALDTPFNSVEELNAKKIMAAALIIAKGKGVFSEERLNRLNGIEAASIADETVSRIKVAYQTSLGNIDVYEGADILIDKATARAMAVADRVVAQGVDFAINKIASVVAESYPRLTPVVETLKYFQPFITHKSQECVRAGITSLNKMAKASIRKTGYYIENKVSQKVNTRLLS